MSEPMNPPAATPHAASHPAPDDSPLVELVPNISSADPTVVAAVADAMRAAGGRVLDTSSDRWHARSVLTAVAAPSAAVDVALACVRAARDHIDLRQHQGVHPRIGAADVVPFVPLRGATMDDAIALAREAGRRIAEELGLPVYLYERAARRPDRTQLADLRRGGFEGLREAIATDPARAPDHAPPGPLALHPSAGASCVGARDFLVAFNVFIGGPEAVPAARAIAKRIRASSGGLPGLKAIGLDVGGRAQVSMNLVDLDRITLQQAWDAVRSEAAVEGMDGLEAELIGLIPQRALNPGCAEIPGLSDIAARTIEGRL
jgi:glutamate formiminotransferase